MALIKCKECKKEFSDKATACPHCGAVFTEAELKKMQDDAKNKVSGWTIFIVIFCVFYLIGKMSSSDDATTEAAPAATEALPPVEDLAKDKLTLDHKGWYQGGFGNIYMGDFKVHNNSDRNIKDITIECTTKGKSGTELNKISTTIYENINANSSKRFREVNMGFIDQQSSTSNCEITDAVFN
jgi:hypothetical protein